MKNARALSRPTGVFIGLTTLDVVHLVEHAPRENEKITATAQFVAAGGPAANAAVTYAALGGEAILVTAIGRGAVADLITADLARCGVTVRDLTPDAVDTAPVSAVAVNPSTGTRSVVSVDATGAAVPGSAAVVSLLESVLEGAAVALIDGHHPAVAVAGASAARAAGIPIVVDAGRWKPIMAELIPCDPEMICSDDFRIPPTKTPAENARELTVNGVMTVVTTHGGDPVDWVHGGAAGSVEVPTVTAVDTLGAGDVFHGAYAFARSNDALDLAERIRFASKIAAHRVSIIGPRTWLESVGEVLASAAADAAPLT